MHSLLPGKLINILDLIETEIPPQVVNVPQQTNTVDCGIYFILFMDILLQLIKSETEISLGAVGNTALLIETRRHCNKESPISLLVVQLPSTCLEIIDLEMEKLTVEKAPVSWMTLSEDQPKLQDQAAQAERQAVNTTIQGSAADIAKAAMLRVDRTVRLRGLQTYLIIHLHDELIYERH
ncbi:hypothetical protein J6590_053579 [Homalodisca vitripennis]|nr:hypothetical protein J6590_053579 [Homalodisca vitripennis]